MTKASENMNFDILLAQCQAQKLNSKRSTVQLKYGLLSSFLIYLSPLWLDRHGGNIDRALHFCPKKTNILQALQCLLFINEKINKEHFSHNSVRPKPHTTVQGHRNIGHVPDVLLVPANNI